MIKKIKVLSLIIALIVNMCVVPTHISYADTISNPIRKIAIKTTALAVAVGSALGITAVNGWEAYKEKFLDPVSSHLRRYEEKDGVIGAYVKDGKTYVSKDMIQDVADYMTENNMYTDVNNIEGDLVIGEYLDKDGIMDNNSFFMSCPYISGWKTKFSSKWDTMVSKVGIPFYFYFTAKNNSNILSKYYVFGVLPVSDSKVDEYKYYKFKASDYISSGYTGRCMTVTYYNEIYELINEVGGIKTYNGCIEVNEKGVTYSSDLYSIKNKEVRIYTSAPWWAEYGFRIGLTNQIVSSPAYSVADKGLSGKTIDNWDSAWAQQVIDVLKDIQINTSISADDISSADESQIIDALPLSLPQYGIDGTTADVAMQNTASIPMSQAKSGEVTLSPSAIDALSEAIAKAISEAGTTTGEQTVTGEITIPQPVYSGLSSYELDLTDVFPFCIPFDLVDLIKVFSASPEAPQFSIPIKYPTGFNSWSTYDLEVDLSPFDSVASVVRTLETVLFILGLLKITRSAMIRG